MSIILGIALYKKVMSVSICDPETKTITGTYFVHSQIFDLAFQRLNEYIKKPIVRTVIAWNDQFDPEYQKKIYDSIRNLQYGKISFVYHQTASAYFACETFFKNLAVDEMFGVINNHFNIYHLTLYKKTKDFGYKAFFVNESSKFDQSFANLALRSKCQNYLINTDEGKNMVEKTRKMFNAKNVRCSNLDYFNGDGIARGAMIKGIHLERGYPTIINDFLPYPIEIIYNHKVQHTVQPFTEAPFKEGVSFQKFEEGTHITIKQKLPKNEKILGTFPSPDEVRYGFAEIIQDEKGIESIRVGEFGNVFTKFKSFWIATGAAVLAIAIMIPFLRRLKL